MDQVIIPITKSSLLFGTLIVFVFSMYEKTDKSNKNVGVKKMQIKKKNFGVLHLATYIFFFQSLNEPGLGAGINPGMALTPFSSSIG